MCTTFRLATSVLLRMAVHSSLHRTSSQQLQLWYAIDFIIVHIKVLQPTVGGAGKGGGWGGAGKGGGWGGARKGGG